MNIIRDIDIRNEISHIITGSVVLVLSWTLVSLVHEFFHSLTAAMLGEILKTDSGNHFRGEYIPRMYHRLLGKIYNLRTIVERKNSNEVVGHHRSKMSNRGIEQARIFVSISNITALLTALTAFKMGRLDLIRSPSAFRRLPI